MTTVAHLLSAKWGQLRNAPRSDDRAHAGAVLLFAAMGIAFWLALFFGARWFFDKCYEVELVGQILVRRVLDMVFLTFLTVLLFSNIVTAFSTFLLADDLPLLVAAPVPSDRLYHARLVEGALQSSWMVLIFGLPVLVAAGVVFSAGPAYYVMAALVLPPFLLIPAVAGSVVALLVATAFPARRSRDVFALLAVLAFAVLYLLFRLLEPERLLDPEGFADLVAFLQTFTAPSSIWLPSYWATEALFPLLRGDGHQGWLFWAVLCTSAAAAVVLGTWIARPLYGEAFSRSLESSVRERLPSRLAQVLLRVLRPPAGWARPSAVRELVRKDIRIFFRDPSQWSQLLLLAALVVVYVVNFKNFKVLDASGLITPLGLHFLNLALAGFVVAALAVRFVFPAVSLEGRAFWILRSAPLPMRTFLRAKLLAALGPLCVFSIGLSLVTSWVIAADWRMALLSVLTLLVLTVGIAGLGAGLGALYPRFSVGNAARIASGYGGVVYMILSMGLVFVALLLEALPTWYLHRVLVLGRHAPSTGRIVAGAALLVAVVGLCALAAWLPMRLGARRLERG